MPFQGIDTYGTTIIKDEGANLLFHLVSAWINLFSCSPKNLRLTGAWTYYNKEEDAEGDGHYETLEFDRDEVIKNLKALADYAQEASKGNYFILHTGI